MKELLLFIASLLLVACSKTDNKKVSDAGNTVEYIAIEHTGRQTYPIRTLIISTRKVNFEVGNEAFGIKRALTREEKDIALSMKYNFIITDTATYRAIGRFIDNNQRFFTNNTNKNHGESTDYSITIKDKTYNIFYKLKDEFFGELIAYSNVNKSDAVLARELDMYLHLYKNH